MRSGVEVLGQPPFRAWMPARSVGRLERPSAPREEHNLSDNIELLQQKVDRRREKLEATEAK